MLNSFSHFRAIAILFIIAGHSFWSMGITFDSTFETTIRNLISGGTGLFVFISGFLFHHVFYEKYDYQRFISGKSKNVLVPYLILGLLPISLYVMKRSDGLDGYFLPNGEGIINEYAIPALKYYLSGRFLVAYWYIPFIMITFALSPLHVKYIKLSTKSQLLITVFFSVVAILIHRPIDNIDVIQSVIYFTPIYLIGITASIHREAIYKALEGKEFYVLVVVILLATYQSSLGIGGGYHKDALTYAGIDLMFIQKILLCFFFMSWLNRFEHYNNKVIHAIANTSFTAFFIHPFILLVLEKLNITGNDSWILYLIFVGTLSATCVLIAIVTKKIAPKYSRLIIGY